MAATAEANGSATAKAKISEKIPAVAHPLAEKSTEIASNIKYHAEYSPHFSPFKFELEQAYYATADSVRDRLIKKFSPWEVVRHDVVFPVRFFGQVEVHPTGSRKWVGGEVIQAVAYDVPIPGYKTKNTNSLRLWEAKACAEDFNLFQFNDGEYESAALLHSRAQQICAVLYPGDATENGKLLRLKQQFFLCSASLQFIAMIKSTRPDLEGKLPGLRVLDNNSQKAVVNGVAQLHSDILKAELFADYVSIWPGKFQNKTNGITPADGSDLQSEWELAKLASKQRLANYIVQVTGVSIDPNSLFDIQVKRIHEYKRQLLNILGAVYRYMNLKVVFVPNYNVSVAEMLIPGSELSQHISTAGMEASGTSNMKFALNGCLIIGTLDGANVEIREEVGETNFFLFGATADEVPRLRKEREGMFKPDPRFEEAKQFIRSGAFGSYDYNPLLESLEGNSGYGRGDYFLVGYDFPSYMDAQERVDEAYKDRKRWINMSILSTAGSGKFSSDRTIAQYAKEIWNINECPVPLV
ncbi:Alpha-glucan phosphorylase, H isozyme [Sesamum angolense]|uniref:Alpha-1,4 glucan phosphorylase n=1 Tax=Sesamum angolense TaxID=2727404 RepID=A0AAE1T6D2_9LAMI|nr:Alpha-glucan phosphorylase, H isozyme [Sesamum angolense]